MTDCETIAEMIEDKREEYICAMDKIWDFAETKFDEYKSSALLAQLLEKEGFRVQKGAAGMDTAIVASWGEGGAKIGFLGEYDALPGLSQRAGETERAPIAAGGNGHGCGHNGIGVGCLAAAAALKEYLSREKIPATVYFFGCPAEETGCGKVFMMRAGLFDGMDALLTWHPGDNNGPLTMGTLAMMQVRFRFQGISSHAGGSPHLGRSALDAVELTDVGANYLREHIVPEARLHYAITDAGGKAPNIVQSHSEVLYCVRAPQIGQAKSIYDRLVNVAKGAALMTGTECTPVFDGAIYNFLPNNTLNTIMQKELERLGPVKPEKDDLRFSQRIAETFSTEEHEKSLARYEAKTAEMLRGKTVSDIVNPLILNDRRYETFSADMGDISWKIPTAQLIAASEALGTPEHSWQMAAQGKSGLFHKATLLAAKIMALTALALIRKPSLIRKARAELSEKLGTNPYECLLPPEFKPGIRS